MYGVVRNSASIWRGLGSSVGIPTPSLFDYYSRQSIALVDASTAGSNGAVVGGRAAYFNGVAWLAIGNTNIGKAHDIEFYMSPTITGSHVILGQSGYSASVYFTGIKFVYRINNAEYNLITVITAGIYKISRNEASLTLYKNGVSVATATIAGGNNVDFVCDRIGQRAGGMYFVGYLSDLSISNSCKFPLNNQYCSITGVAATVNVVTFPLVTSFTPQSTIDALDLGYTQLSTGEQIPNAQFALPVGATKHEGGQLHNLIDSFICFNPTGSLDTSFDIFDRRIDTIQSATSRSSIYYNSTNRITASTYHISEIPYDVLNTYFLEDYQDKVFVAIEQDYDNKDWYFRIFGYSTKQSGSNLITILKYINYYQTVN